MDKAAAAARLALMAKITAKTANRKLEPAQHDLEEAVWTLRALGKTPTEVQALVTIALDEYGELAPE